MSDLVQKKLIAAKLWVVKVGSALLSDNSDGVDLEIIDAWCKQIGALSRSDRSIVLVSSGAVAEGCRRLGFGDRPEALHELQAAAAVGQMGLVGAYERAFKVLDLRTAMVLLTHDDLADRKRYLNARATLRTLIELKVIPVINENDSVATDEIKLGDNDTLAAMVASALSADVLVLLTDQDGLHERDPREDPDAPVVEIADATDPKLDAYASGGGTLGRGGMVTKVAAARLAARSGITTVIANGNAPNVLMRISQGEAIGTVLESKLEPLVARKRWLASQLKVKGRIALDDGAVRAIQEKGVSILAVGVFGSSGSFERGDMVSVTDAQGDEVAKGLVNYNARETQMLLGCSTDEIESKLGYIDAPELIHRDNLVVL
jgi:glutamate 5-kinase